MQVVNIVNAAAGGIDAQDVFQTCRGHFGGHFDHPLGEYGVCYEAHVRAGMDSLMV